ncbi:hypothetical protein WJX79_006705 [Trebouxia sp. C0005]
MPDNTLETCALSGVTKSTCAHLLADEHSNTVHPSQLHVMKEVSCHGLQLVAFQSAASTPARSQRPFPVTMIGSLLLAVPGE